MDLILDCKEVRIEGTKFPNHPIRVMLKMIDRDDLKNHSEELLDSLGREAVLRHFNIEEKSD